MISCPVRVAAGMDDAAPAMRRLETEGERASAPRSKATPQPSQLLDCVAAPRLRSLDRRPGRRGRRPRRACRSRAARRLVLADGGGDAALRPGAGRGRRRRARGASTVTGSRREVQRRHQSGEASADDDWPAGERPDRVHERPPLRAPACARRRGARGAATAGSIVTSYVHRLERAADLRQRDALHVRAEIAGPHELDRRDARPRRCRSSSIRSRSTTRAGLRCPT